MAEKQDDFFQSQSISIFTINHEEFLAMCLRKILLIIVVSAIPIFALGEAAVITLEFPHGAENCGMGETGVSLADNINSIFWNPASIPAIGENLHVQYIYSESYESLLPTFHLKDLWHSDTIHALFITDIYKNIDFGASYSVNFINMGENIWTDSLGLITGKSRISETVRSYAAGLRFFNTASVGLAVKEIESRLAPGIDTLPFNGIAKAQVFDFGVRLEKKFTIAEALDIHPAIGIALHSFPQDSVTYLHYDTISRSDPLPLKRWYGASVTFNLLDVIGVAAAREREYSVVNQTFIDHKGYKIQITPFFALLSGSMIDSLGDRFEDQSGWVMTFNYQRTVTALSRWVKLFNPALSEKIQFPNYWAARHHINPNIHLQFATSDIHTKGDNTAREGQTRNEFSFGVSIIGDLRSLSINKLFAPASKTSASKPAVDPKPALETSKKEPVNSSISPEINQSETETTKVKSTEDNELVK